MPEESKDRRICDSVQTTPRGFTLSTSGLFAVVRAPCADFLARQRQGICTETQMHPLRMGAPVFLGRVFRINFNATILLHPENLLK